MKFIKSTLISAGFAVAGSAASAAYLDVTSINSAHIWVDSAPVAGTDSFHAFQGPFQATDATNDLGLGNSFVAWCLDIQGAITPTDFTINNVNPYQPGRVLSDFQRKNVENLFDAAYGMVDVNNDVDAGAFQLAIWEAGYETDESTNLSMDDGTRIGGGSYHLADGGAAITARANEFLSKIYSWNGDDNYAVNFLDAGHDATQDYQDLVTAAPVPVPAAGLLMLGGLGAIGALRRRSKKKAA